MLASAFLQDDFDVSVVSYHTFYVTTKTDSVPLSKIFIKEISPYESVGESFGLASAFFRAFLLLSNAPTTT